MSYLTKGSTLSQIIHRTDSTIDISSETEMTVMLKFSTANRQFATNRILSTFNQLTASDNGFMIGFSQTRSVLMRVRTDTVHTFSAVYTDSEVQTCFLKVNLVTRLATAYINGVEQTPLATGSAWYTNTFDFKLFGGVIDGDDHENFEAAYWVGHAIDSSQVAAYQSGTDLDSLLVPPTEIYRLNGTEGTLADPLPAQNNSPALDLKQVQGSVTAPDRPVFGVPSVSPPPSVPAGYTRYTTDIATANVVSAFSFFFGIAVEDGMTVDWVNSVEVLLEAGKATGFILSAPITTTAYFWYPSTGDYIGVEFTYNGVSFSVISFGGLSLGIGIGLSFGYSSGGSVVQPVTPWVDADSWLDSEDWID